MSLKLEVVQMEIPEKANIIIGQAHFIKTVEDIYETLITSCPNIKFGIAFCEASGKRLIRWDGNDDELIKTAIENAEKIGAGHTFVILIREGWPINVINNLKNIQEIVNIYCATSNPTQVVIAETKQGRGIVGVIDGFKPLGVEEEEDIKERITFLRKIGYKRG